MLLNPRRVLTPKGRSQLLGKMFPEDGPGLFYGMNAYAVTAVTVNPVSSAVTAVTLGANSTGNALVLEGTADVFQSQSGKYYTTSDIVLAEQDATAGTNNIIGVIIGSDATPENCLAFLEFDEPILLDQASEGIRMVVECGFDGQTFYILPRILPVGM